MSDSAPPMRYRVDYSRVLPAVKYYSYLSKRLGFMAELAQSLRRIDEQLKMSPLKWGDPLRELQGMNAKFFRGMDSLLIVYYAVHNVQPVVFVQSVERSPYSAFFGP